MSGHFKLTNTGQEPKHAHLKFYRHDGTTLSFVDVRRFGKWKLGETWGVNRGPDPTMEPDEFRMNILKNLDKKPFDQPIHLVLMNQKYFNGIGNYLRAEILYRLPHVNPFMEAKEVIENCEIIFIALNHTAFYQNIDEILNYNKDRETIFIDYWNVSGKNQIIFRS